MFTAITENNRKVDIDWAVIHPNVKYYCPCCHARLIVKNGKINAAHFAHENLVDCDDFSNDMSDWHKNWQERFPVEHREIVITHDIDEAANANRIFVMKQGQLVKEGTPEDIFSEGPKLIELGLDLPFPEKLKQVLKDQGLAVPDYYLSEKGMVDWLWTSVLNK